MMVGRWTRRNESARHSGGQIRESLFEALERITKAAGAYQLRRRREALIERDRALRTFGVDRLAEGWSPEQIFRLAEGRKRTSSVGRELRDDLRLHLSGSPKGRAVVALSHASSQTPPATPIETFARYHQESRLHPRTAQDCRRQNRGRPLGGLPHHL